MSSCMRAARSLVDRNTGVRAPYRIKFDIGGLVPWTPQ